MPKPYMALRFLMKAMGWDQDQVGKVIGKSGRYVSPRMNARISWELEDCFAILKEAGKPDSDILKYFPRDPWEMVDF